MKTYKTQYVNKYARILMFIVALAACLYGASAFAGIRCQGQIIGVGDPEYVVEQACGTPVDYHQVGNGHNSSGDEAYAIYKIDGQLVEIHYIDGHVYTIGGDENRN